MLKRVHTTNLIIISVMFLLIPASWARGIDASIPRPGTGIPDSITTPDQVETMFDTLSFDKGFPVGDTAATVSDQLLYLRGVDAFLNTIQGVSTYAIRQGLLSVGVEDNDVLIYSRLMDSNSLFLTANADTVYYMSVIDLSEGPMVFESPPNALGVIDDMWFRWVTDFGFAGSDRGEGGRYLLVPPEYEGELPDGGYYIRPARTNRVLVLGRSFLTENDPAPTVNEIKETMMLYPYVSGGRGTSIGSFLTGEASTLGAPAERKKPRYVEGSGLSFNTIPPNDFGHYEMLNQLVQMEPASALDPELAGQFAAIGIVKGKEFNPDERSRQILMKAVAFGNAAARTLGMGAHPEDHFRYYEEDSVWWNPLFFGGYSFTVPPPEITADGIEPYPDTNAYILNNRSAFFYSATGITPAMCMRLTGVGSQYLLAGVDEGGNPLNGSYTYRVTLPRDIPAERFWSFTAYNDQTRSMIQTPQLYPRAGSQSYPSPAAEQNGDGSTTIYFASEKPEGIAQGNWIQTNPGENWFVILRLYSPLQSFFDKTWRIGEIEKIEP